LALLYVLMRFPVRGGEPAEALPEGVSKHSRCGVSGVASKAPKPDESPSGMQGNKNEAMTTES
jgi:hypothetical protein